MFDEEELYRLYEAAERSIIENVNGYNSLWQINFEVPKGNETKFTMTVTVVIPSGRIDDYDSYYKRHFGSKYTVKQSDVKSNWKTFEVKGGVASCRG